MSAVEKRAPEQEMFRGYDLPHPTRTAVTSGVQSAGFAEGPTPAIRSKHGARHSSIGVAKIDAAPGGSSVTCPKQVGLGLIFCFEFKDGPITDQPPVLFVREINVL